MYSNMCIWVDVASALETFSIASGRGLGRLRGHRWSGLERENFSLFAKVHPPFCSSVTRWERSSVYSTRPFQPQSF